MHEMSLCEGILRIVEDHAKRDHFTVVRTIWLELGQLSHVEPEAMAFCFEAVKRGTLAAEAKLEIIRVSGQAWCLDCSETVDVAARYDPCPRCGGHKLQVTSGDDMRIKEMEVV